MRSRRVQIQCNNLADYARQVVASTDRHLSEPGPGSVKMAHIQAHIDSIKTEQNQAAHRLAVTQDTYRWAETLAVPCEK